MIDMKQNKDNKKSVREIIAIAIIIFVSIVAAGIWTFITLAI